jgi:hypothetical protein
MCQQLRIRLRLMLISTHLQLTLAGQLLSHQMETLSGDTECTWIMEKEAHSLRFLTVWASQAYTSIAQELKVPWSVATFTTFKLQLSILPVKEPTSKETSILE